MVANIVRVINEVTEIIEVVEAGPRGLKGEDGLITWSATKSDYVLYDKVSYLSGIYNVHTAPVPAGTLPTDENYWEPISGGGGGSVEPVRGGVAPDDWDVTVNYVVDDRVSINDKEYRCINDNVGAFVLDDWNEVSTQSNEQRLSAIEQGSSSYIINEYSFTQNTSSSWLVTNAGETQADFNSAKIEFFLNGVKLRKGADVAWVSDNDVVIPFLSVATEDFLDIRVTTSASVAQDPTESEYSIDSTSGGIWTVTGIGATLSDFDNAKVQIYFNGVKLRKGTQAVWVSPTEIQINYRSVNAEDYLTIRNDA